MPVERLTVAAGDDVAAAAARVRALVPGAGHVAVPVAALIDDVRRRGDRALREHVAQLDRANGVAVEPLVVPAAELDTALTALDAELRAALELAAANIAAVAQATVHADQDVTLPQGQQVRVREVPVGRAAVYVPGGRAPYPSTALMGVVTARAAGVQEVVVATPSDDPVLRAACRLAGADRVYRMGGAHAIAALAYGTETVDRVDVIVGPGNLWVQEAKRQLGGQTVGVDGFAGPSDLLVLADGTADPELVALDLAAQAEHGDGSLVVLVTDALPLLRAVWARLEGGIGGANGTENGAAYASVLVDGPETGLAVAEAFAPEHLELVGASIEPLAPRVSRAGCVFVGAASATAFGDYVVGSNHTLPTDGAARFGSTLSGRTFRRTLCEVHVGAAAEALAEAGARIADAEGFAVHAASMRARQNRTGR